MITAYTEKSTPSVGLKRSQRGTKTKKHT